ncbi:MAG TPA: J domain-containing protein [Bryobacteraceae bacterium]|nr:J domain-containing protein [Bryobacteraceae bacterium]
MALYADIKLQINPEVQVDLQVSSLTAASKFVETFIAPDGRSKFQKPGNYSAFPETPKHSGSGRTWAAKILSVDVNATPEEVVIAYRRLAQMYHPDKVASLAPEFQELADHKMKDINRAFSILKQAE